jgi:hypothetical protein
MHVLYKLSSLLCYHNRVSQLTLSIWYKAVKVNARANGNGQGSFFSPAPISNGRKRAKSEEDRLGRPSPGHRSDDTAQQATVTTFW